MAQRPEKRSKMRQEPNGARFDIEIRYVPAPDALVRLRRAYQLIIASAERAEEERAHVLLDGAPREANDAN